MTCPKTPREGASIVAGNRRGIRGRGRMGRSRGMWLLGASTKQIARKRSARFRWDLKDDGRQHVHQPVTFEIRLDSYRRVGRV